MSQTSYDRDFNVAFAGMKADSRFDEVQSFQAENAIQFGRGVVRGTNPETQAKLPASTSDTFLGVAIHEHKEPSAAGVARYEDTETVNILRKGAVWAAIANVAITAGQAAYLETGTSGTGQFTNATSGTTLLTGCVFETDFATGSTPQIAKLAVNLP